MSGRVKTSHTLLAVFCLALLALVVSRAGAESEGSGETADHTGGVLRSSMVAKNHVGLDRLEQTELQQACSNPRDWPATDEQARSLQQAAMASVDFPAQGSYLGDWREGEKIAQNGRGMQYSDDPEAPNGGNCYACHQLDPAEIAAGNIGPSLTGYGQRGQSEQVLRYTWAKIWNPHAYLVCSHMPRFGDAGILTPDQIRHVMALLLDPNSPVNR
jgi:sulfur-oxidizing protein SoxX